SAPDGALRVQGNREVHGARRIVGRMGRILADTLRVLGARCWVLGAGAGCCWVLGALLHAQAPAKYKAADGKVRVALAQQPFSPNGPSPGPKTMAGAPGDGIQKALADLGATVRVQEAALTADENTEYGGWKRLGLALGHFADLVAANEREGYFSVGLYATCPS